jgi:hypothetical protein
VFLPEREVSPCDGRLSSQSSSSRLAHAPCSVDIDVHSFDKCLWGSRKVLFHSTGDTTMNRTVRVPTALVEPPGGKGRQSRQSKLDYV